MNSTVKKRIETIEERIKALGEKAELLKKQAEKKTPTGRFLLNVLDGRGRRIHSYELDSRDEARKMRLLIYKLVVAKLKLKLKLEIEQEYKQA